MTSPQAQEAARALARTRWGSTRARSLAAELVDRVGELPPADAAALRAALGPADSTTSEEDV